MLRTPVTTTSTPPKQQVVRTKASGNQDYARDLWEGNDDEDWEVDAVDAELNGGDPERSRGQELFNETSDRDEQEKTRSLSKFNAPLPISLNTSHNECSVRWLFSVAPRDS